MIYFVNEGLSAASSGIEHAEFDRARVFRKAQRPFQLLTTTYLSKLHDVLPVFDLSDAESCNLFDYFQDALSVPKKPLALSDVDFGLDVELTMKTAQLYEARAQQHFIGRVHLDLHGQLASVEYFDGYQNLYKVETYDSRGFKSLTQLYAPDGTISTELWHTPKGQIVITKTYSLTTHGKRMATWQLRRHVFDSLQAVRKYFYDCLNATGTNLFIIDRTNVSEWQLTQLLRPAYLLLMLHNHQGSDSRHPDAPLLNDNYEWVLANMNQWNAIVSATPQQTRDLAKRWPGHRYFTVPVGVIPDLAFQRPPIPMGQRRPDSLLVTARIAPEKGIDKMIRAIAMAQKERPKLTLDVYGYVDHSHHDAAMTAIKAAMKTLPVSGSVRLHPYTQSIRPLRCHAQVYLVYSQMEGFNLALMEAQAEGMVGLTNDVNYGPNELVQNGQNGYVTPFDDVTAYAQKLVTLFKQPEHLQEMSNQAYALSKRYSETAVLAKWQAVFDDYDHWAAQQA